MSRPADPSALADALASLAAMVRAGDGLRTAIAAWPTRLPPGLRERALRYGAAVAAGASAADLEMIPPADEQDRVIAQALVESAFAERLGAGPAAAALESRATELRSRAHAHSEAMAETSGGRLSGRLVAGLPIAFLLLVPVASASWRDPVALLLMGLGCVAMALGIRWMARLMPSPPVESPAAAVARTVASLIATGTIASQALSFVAERHDWAPLRRAAMATRLGVGWIDALYGVNDDRCNALGRILAAGRRPGHETTRELERFADEVSAASRVEFDRALKRAPVLMVLPLTLCLLPGFALVTLGPFLRRLMA